MSRPTVLFYCQHSLGLGHLVRSFALAGALAERFRVVVPDMVGFGYTERPAGLRCDVRLGVPTG
jgi:predicted glycosyltransferase